MNMSYCKFENTNSDLLDCLNALNEMQSGAGEKLSDSELMAAKNLASTALEIVAMLTDHVGINFDDHKIGQHLDSAIYSLNDEANVL